MTIKLNLPKSLILFILLLPFLIYFTGTAAIGYTLILLCIFAICLKELVKPSRLSTQSWLSILLWVPYSTYSIFTYFMNPYEDKFISAYSITFISIPFVTFSILKLQKKMKRADYNDLLFKIIMYFVGAQLVICLGQIATYTTGFGFPVSSSYSHLMMITGTFLNSNNLATLITLLAACFTTIEKDITKYKLAVWLMIFALLLMTGSRTALLITTLHFIYTRKLSLKNLIIILTLVLSSLISIKFIFSNLNFLFISRIQSRLESFINIYQNGFGSDESTFLRIQSYRHFFRNLTDLGLGTGKINDYYRYAENATFSTDLIFSNPHSLIIEISYWSGWLGLIAFLLPMLYLLGYNKHKFITIILFISTSLIPSTLIGDLPYFLILMLFYIPYSYKDTLNKKIYNY